MMRLLNGLAVVAIATFSPIALSQVLPLIQPPASDIHPLDAVVVKGAAQGPGLWHVYAGENDLWVLGTLSPLPAGITWNTEILAQVASDAQEVIWEPYYSVDVKAGFFQKLLLGYNMSKAGKNPDGKTLRQVMTPDLYARWARLKARYLRNDRDVDTKRPLMAAEELFRAAITANGLSNRRIWIQPLRDSITATGAKSNAPKVVVSLDPAKAKAMLKEVQTISFNDASCMDATLDAIELDLPRMITNANAWATGNLERINFSHIQRRDRACADVFSNNEVSRKYGLPNIDLAINDRFMQEVERALKRNRTTVVVVPLENMLGPNGYAARLRAKGYEVTDP